MAISSGVIKEESLLLKFEDDLKDRFGKIPNQTVELMNTVRLRWKAMRLGLSKIILKNNNTEILNYQTAVHYPPAKVDTAYRKSGFIHPLMSPSGNILTRIDAPDHYHHFGIWNPWTKVKIRDHVTDFWNLASKQGTVRFAGINTTVNGPVYGGFSIRQEHIDFLGKKPEELAINEVWDVRAWNVEPVAGVKAWLVDLTTFLSVAGDSTIVFEAYRYAGGIGFRATAEWNKDNSSVLTS